MVRRRRKGQRQPGPRRYRPIRCRAEWYLLVLPLTNPHAALWRGGSRAQALNTKEPRRHYESKPSTSATSSQLLLSPTEPRSIQRPSTSHSDTNHAAAIHSTAHAHSDPLPLLSLSVALNSHGCNQHSRTQLGRRPQKPSAAEVQEQQHTRPPWVPFLHHGFQGTILGTSYPQAPIPILT